MDLKCLVQASIVCAHVQEIYDDVVEKQRNHNQTPNATQKRRVANSTED